MLNSCTLLQTTTAGVIATRMFGITGSSRTIPAFVQAQTGR